MIKIFDGNTDDFSGQGYGYVYPTKAEVHGVAGGEFEILLELPIDKSRDDWEIDHQRIISAPAPVRSSPEINFGISGPAAVINAFPLKIGSEAERKFFFTVFNQGSFHRYSLKENCRNET